MKRKTLIQLHLYFSGISTFILFLYISSGSLHLVGGLEQESSEVVSHGIYQGNLDKKDIESFFKRQLESIEPSYHFDYIKGGGASYFTRPTTRTSYTLNFENGAESYTIQKNTPNFFKRVMEFHKGHGPVITRTLIPWISILFILTLITGLWLGLSVRQYRKVTLFTFVTGLGVVFLLFSL